MLTTPNYSTPLLILTSFNSTLTFFLTDFLDS